MVMKKIVVSIMLACFASQVHATALTAARNTPARSGDKINLGVASNVIIYAGSLVCVNSSGKAVPAADSSGYAVVGRAGATIDNRTAVYSASATIDVDQGIFLWVNGDAIVDADIGKLVYVTDDQTVNKTGGGQNIIAGTVVKVASDGVWIDTAKIGPSGAAAPASLAVTGAATVGTTLAVSGATTVAAATASGLVTANAGLTASGAIQLKGAITGTNGVITLTNIPTSTNGLTTGMVWANSGVLTLKP